MRLLYFGPSIDTRPPAEGFSSKDDARAWWEARFGSYHGPILNSVVDEAPDETKRIWRANAKLRERIRLEAQQEAREEDRKAARTAAPEFELFSDRLARPRRLKEWRIVDWQQIGHRVVFAAQFKAGKTTTVIGLVRVLLEKDQLFLGKWEVSPIEEGGTLAVLDFEMAEDEPGQLDEWYEAAGVNRESEAAKRLYLVPMRGRASAFDVTDDAVREEWVARLRAANVKYLVADCLRPVLDALGLSEHSEAGVFLVAFDRLLTEAGIREAVLVHHMGHPKEGSPNERSRGDSRILDWPDVNWNLVREKPDDPASTRFIKAYGRGVDVPETQVSLDSGSLVAVGGSRADAKKDRMKQAILAALAGGEMGTGDLRDSVDGGHKPEFTATLKALQKAGLVSQRRGEGRGKPSVYSLSLSEVPF